MNYTMEEVWKPVIYIYSNGKRIDFTGLYEVSNTLKLKYLNYKGKNGKEKIINLNDIKQNERYFLVSLYKNNKVYNCRIHRLILSSFQSETKIYKCIDHIDGNTHNNYLSNLKFCEYAENITNPIRIKKTQNSALCKKVIQKSLDNKLIKIWNSTNEIEREKGYYHSSIVRCCNGKQRNAYGYKWEYKNGE